MTYCRKERKSFDSEKDFTTDADGLVIHNVGEPHFARTGRPVADASAGNGVHHMPAKRVARKARVASKKKKGIRRPAAKRR
jgi:hypothetical protein